MNITPMAEHMMMDSQSETVTDRVLSRILAIGESRHTKHYRLAAHYRIRYALA